MDQNVLVGILKEYISDQDTEWLLSEIVESFRSTREGVGLPLGNLTSQLLVNIYMNEFDQFVKHKINARYYIRYADDFVFFSRDKKWLRELVRYIVLFLREWLKLELHPQKVSITTLASGIDFLGLVYFPDYRVLRTTTKKRMFQRIAERERDENTIGSYLGMLSHGNIYKIRTKLLGVSA